jgi:hypothetical protein
LLEINPASRIGRRLRIIQFSGSRHRCHRHTHTNMGTGVAERERKKTDKKVVKPMLSNIVND